MECVATARHALNTVVLLEVAQTDSARFKFERLPLSI